MSGVFENQSTTTDNSSTDTDTGNLDDYVGEGKKFASTDVALKAVPHQLQHISKIEAENAALREETVKLKTLQEHLQKSNSNQVNNRDDTDDGPTGQTKSVTLDDVKSIIREQRTEEQIEANSKVSLTAAITAFGNQQKANIAVTKKAAELGMSVDQINQLAATSPQAFKELMGIKGKQSSFQQTSSSDFNHQTIQSDQSNDKANIEKQAYWNDLRRSNYKQWVSRSNERMAVAQRVGEDYFS